ncbi:MAG: hypothetical protein NTZ72_07730 [Afipia sp.]|nr:hypothetical protein [Afipia sp.]
MGKLRMTVLIGAALLSAVSHVRAQSEYSSAPGFRLNEGKTYTDEEKARMKANEDAAKAARSTLPDAKVSSDPWAGARAAEAPVKSPKAVKPKAPAQ